MNVIGHTGVFLFFGISGFILSLPFLKLYAAAAPKKGILQPSNEAQQAFLSAWQKYLTEGHKIIKFVPASGAASRMFKDLSPFVMQIMIRLKRILSKLSSTIFTKRLIIVFSTRAVCAFMTKTSQHCCRSNAIKILFAHF